MKNHDDNHIHDHDHDDDDDNEMNHSPDCDDCND
jgi:hypothetical protein